MAVNAYIAIQADVAGTPADTSKTWNAISAPTVGTAIADLEDDAANLTGWGFEVTAAPDAEGSNGVNAVGTGDAAWVDEAVISEDYQAVASSTAVYQFTGLDNTKTYTISVFGSRTGSGTNHTTEISIDGFSTVADSVQCLNNSTLIAQAVNVSPASGIINLSWRKSAAAASAFCNAVWIRENDAAPGGLSIPIVMHHRRQMGMS